MHIHVYIYIFIYIYVCVCFSFSMSLISRSVNFLTLPLSQLAHSETGYEAPVWPSTDLIAASIHDQYSIRPSI